MFTHDGKQVILDLEAQELELLMQLYGQLHELLAQDEMEVDADPLIQLMNMDGPTAVPQDEALARLFPNAYLNDEEAASDFRRFTEPDLRRKKLSCVRDVLSQLQVFDAARTLDSQQTQNWLLSLNDLRLVLGTRIGVGEHDDDDDLEVDQDEDESAIDPDRDPGFFLYDYLTYLQGTLIDVL
jgi:hypothetical protein